MRKTLEISSLKHEILRFPVLKGSKRLNIYGFQVKVEFNSKMNLGKILVTTNIDSKGDLILLSENCCEVKDYGLYYEINEIHHLSEEIEYSFCYIDNGKLLNGKILM